MWGSKILPRGNKSGKPGPNATVGARFAQDEYRRGQGTEFCSGCGAWRGELGLEPTFDLYIKHLCGIFDEVKRVLKKTGTCWVNLGDTYWGSGRGPHTKYISGKEESPAGSANPARGDDFIDKSLCQIPARFSIEMCNRGWILRNDIIWEKPNCMPSSRADGFTIDYEHLFFFAKSNQTQYWTNEKSLELVSKQPLGIKGIETEDWEWRKCPSCEGSGKDEKVEDGICERCKGTGKIQYNFWSGHDYYFEQQFEEYTEDLNRWGGDALKRETSKTQDYFAMQKIGNSSALREGRPMRPNEQGRNKRCVWKIPTKPYPEAHFATYPPELCEPAIKAGCPQYVCKKCSKPREKIYQKVGTKPINMVGGHKKAGGDNPTYSGNTETPVWEESGYTDCGCKVGWDPGIVMDPFCGSGTTCAVAKELGRNWMGIELNPEYIKLAEERIRKSVYQPNLTEV